MDAISDWTFRQNRAVRGLVVFLLVFTAAALLFMALGSIMLAFGVSYTQVLAGAVGCGIGTGLVNGIASFWWQP